MSQPNYRKTKDNVEQRNYIIRPALKDKFTKEVNIFIHTIESL